jgi:mono/diheme cytochrome c family protein
MRVQRPLFAVVVLTSATVAMNLGTQSAILGRGQPPPPLMLDSITGRDSFEFYCAACHGKTGKGDGPIVPALKTRPTDLTSLARRNGGSFPRDRVLGVVTGTGRPVTAHGSSDMPPWGPIFRGLDPSEPRVRLRIENIVTHVETLQEPSTGPDDLGARLFKTHCATCHGPNGRGNGPLADQLRRMTPDLTKFTARNGGVFPSERVQRIIDGRDVPSHGDRDMPVWGDVFRDSREGGTSGSAKARIDAIVKYLQGIQERAAD